MVNVNGINLYYRQSGQGTPLILLHGNGENHHIFDLLIHRLAAHFTIYAIDSRNHGQSEKTTDYSYNAMADDLNAFIDTLNLKNVNIIGFSDGAIIALLLALKRQSIINKMVLLGVNLSPNDFTDECYQFIKDSFEVNADPLFKMMLEQPNIELASLTQITVPTLIIGAEHDIYKPELFNDIASTLPNGSLKIMLGHQHDSYIVNSDIIYPDLMAFLTQNNDALNR
ncbi:alpha/beta hydrolase [Orbus wheelerorum]|uniref:alpha/beta fold hydrolase n=1 Tax=Orbus wheelerorum TaxID=3074111 RepID=UPI00370D2655